MERGVRDAMSGGVLAGYPVVDLRITLVDGSFHEVDSSEMAFRIAASMAYKSGLERAKPTILEPIMGVEIFTPEEYLGDVVGNLNARRGIISAMDARPGVQVVTASAPLAENVRRNAINAAFHDPRFPPLDLDELDRIAVEVSVLSPPAALSYEDADDLMSGLRPGLDGVILRKGASSATFLPQVWKQLPRCQDFLSHLCLKAGLSARAWYDGKLQVETYQVQSFEEGR